MYFHCFLCELETSVRLCICRIILFLVHFSIVSDFQIYLTEIKIICYEQLYFLTAPQLYFTGDCYNSLMQVLTMLLSPMDSSLSSTLELSQREWFCEVWGTVGSGLGAPMRGGEWSALLKCGPRRFCTTLLLLTMFPGICDSHHEADSCELNKESIASNHEWPFYTEVVV